MISKSLANDFQYTKLKYKQYLYFSLNIPLMFLLCFFLFSLFIRPCFFFLYLNFSLNLIHFYLIYYQESIIKLSILHTVEITRFFRKKQETKQLFCYSLQLKGCAHYSLLVDITHYWLLKFVVEVKFLVGRQISSRSLVNVNYKYATEEIYPVLLKQQSMKSSTTKS